MNRFFRFGFAGMVLCSTGLWGCGQGASTADKNTATTDTSKVSATPTGDVGDIENQIMDLHDKTMAAMDTVMTLKTDLKGIAANNHSLTTAQNDSIDANLHRLQKADDDMMDWMNQFQEPDKKMEHAKAMEYMAGQLNTIKGINTGMHNSFRLANAFISQNKAQK